jgi:amidophosphoribosyltransferase
MCGIVGLLIKKPELQPHLGEWLVPMLEGMAERGPDSAGLALFRKPSANGQIKKYSLFDPTGQVRWQELLEHLKNRQYAETAVSASLTSQANHAILHTNLEPPILKPWLAECYPAVYVLSVGSSIELYKDVGSPGAIAQKYQFHKLAGSHAVGHTRMATESAVTPAHAHPFTAGEDFCLVHNGSLSNPHSLRRKLEKQGIHFDTDNDTEAACRFLEWRLREGDDLATALAKGAKEFDGFYTFLMGTGDQLALVRDAFACKPAVVAETEDYVAIASEFRSLAHLPHINDAHIFEPAPEELHIWKA